MPDLPWLDGYSGQTTDELIALETTYRIDSLVTVFEHAIEQKAYREGDDKLTAEERVVLAVEALEREVNNGGYSQFFINSSREYGSIIVESLRQIGCNKTADITQNAVHVIEEMPITDGEWEDGDLIENDERDSALEQYNEQFYSSQESLEESLFTFIKANRSKIEL